jgi:homocysteine S-methyltransferase
MSASPCDSILLPGCGLVAPPKPTLQQRSRSQCQVLQSVVQADAVKRNVGAFQTGMTGGSAPFRILLQSPSSTIAWRLLMSSRYRAQLPQLAGALFLTDGGIETTLVYHQGVELPCFAAFHLLKDEGGTGVLRAYFERYARLARAQGLGLVLEAPTWRANADWAARLGYDRAALAAANRGAIDLLVEVREAYEDPATPIVISGNLGPRGDGYRPGLTMSVSAARGYHAAQIDTFAATPADLVAAFTMNYPQEAIGIALAARAAAMPVVISFTVETDGRLPSGATLAEAIVETDDASGGYPSYYMINCAHPEHLIPALERGGSWVERVRGLRANASRRSHAELDQCTDLDIGDPEELGRQYADLRTLLPRLSVAGGCCGTDHRHVEAIAASLQGVEVTTTL